MRQSSTNKLDRRPEGQPPFQNAHLDIAVAVHVERQDGRLQLVVGELGAHLVAEPRELRGGEAPVPVLVEVRERLAGLFGRGSWDSRSLVSVQTRDAPPKV